ncbi:GGDEF domain-containing protein [Neptuniibacter sp. SY11_33]|uniref:GGDEF domain-containing protein n=1 Tax=Neptuniibacter sp. SY11_33 TaxID=3398215 RepID=UPI0039F5766C
MQPTAKVSDYCDVFLALTEQRDQRALNQLLIKTCLDLFPLHHFWLYNYANFDQSTEKLIASSESSDEFSSPLAIPEQIQHIEPHQPSRFIREEGYRYYSFKILHSQNGVLISNIEDTTDLMHDVITKLVSVYANQRFFMFSAMNDALTGLYNRQAFDQQMDTLLLKQQSQRRKHDKSSEHHCFALLDIDHFKQVNDNFGHLFGDEVLLILSQQMQNAFRDEDLMFRYGGEEFALVLKDISLDSALNVLERFRTQIAQTSFPQIGQVTLSIGITEITEGLSLPALIDRADQALYFAKEHGRNQVHSYETLLNSGYLTPPSEHEGDIELF